MCARAAPWCMRVLEVDNCVDNCVAPSLMLACKQGEDGRQKTEDRRQKTPKPQAPRSMPQEAQAQSTARAARMLLHQLLLLHCRARAACVSYVSATQVCMLPLPMSVSPRPMQVLPLPIPQRRRRGANNAIQVKCTAQTLSPTP
jgi:hypothetical protein